MLKVTQLLKIRFGVRVICTQILRLPELSTLDEGFKLYGFFTNKMGMLKPFWDFVRVKDDVDIPPA